MYYRYRAVNDRGTAVTDTIIAKNKRLAIAELEARGWTVEKMSVDVGAFLTGLFGSSVGGVSFKDRLVMTRNLAVMVRAGMTLDESISILAEQSTNAKLSSILVELNESIRAGKGFGEGLSDYPKVFPSLYVNIVIAAERGGTLDASLLQLADQMEKTYDLRTKVRNALFYPVLVVSATIIVGILVSVFVLPKVTRLFISFDTQLPLTTRMLLAFSNLVTTQPIALSGIILAIFIFIGFFTRSKLLQPIWHRVLLKTPVAGRISRYFNIALFARTLKSLLTSGVPINEALEVTAGTLRNVRYRAMLQRVVEQQQTGESLGNLLREDPKLFPPLVYRMITVGEESGNLEDTLSFIAEFFENEVDSITKNLSTILEPLLLIIIGTAVGVVALAIITPIYQITGSFQFS